MIDPNAENEQISVEQEHNATADSTIDRVERDVWSVSKFVSEKSKKQARKIKVLFGALLTIAVGITSIYGVVESTRLSKEHLRLEKLDREQKAREKGLLAAKEHRSLTKLGTLWSMARPWGAIARFRKGDDLGVVGEGVERFLGVKLRGARKANFEILEFYSLSDQLGLTVKKDILNTMAQTESEPDLWPAAIALHDKPSESPKFLNGQFPPSDVKYIGDIIQSKYGDTARDLFYSGFLLRECVTAQSLWAWAEYDFKLRNITQSLPDGTRINAKGEREGLVPKQLLLNYLNRNLKPIYTSLGRSFPFTESANYISDGEIWYTAKAEIYSLLGDDPAMVEELKSDRALLVKPK